MKTSLFSFLLFFMLVKTQAKVDTVSVETAAANKMIKLDILGVGGYQGKCISMKLKSLQPDSVLIHVEAGRRLDSKDSSQQDILIVKDEYILMVQKKEINVDVTGFCCQAHNKSPAAKSIFFVGALAEKNLYQLAVFISKAKLNNNSIQNAVWSISDNNELSSVTDDGTEEVNKLRRFLSKLKGVEVPWYNILYKKAPGQLFSGKPEKVTGDMKYYISDVAQVVVTIRNSFGTIVYTKKMGSNIARGEYTHHLNWVVGETPNAVYTLGLYENGRELKKLSITLK